MEFERLLELVGDEPVFETALLLAGNANPQNVRLQLTRWVKSGRVYQLPVVYMHLLRPTRKSCRIHLSLRTTGSGLPGISASGLFPDPIFTNATSGYGAWECSYFRS